MGDVSEGERSWVVSEEPFWHLSDKINTLRLRAAYGESGRQPQAFSALRTFTDAWPGRRHHGHARYDRQRRASPGAWKGNRVGFETGCSTVSP